MRLSGDRYECALCGVVLDLPVDATPKVTIKAASGKPNIRILAIGRREIHRCEVASA